jgi:ABC-type transport system substrate-binding protein
VQARQAIAFATNRERFTETILRGQSQATNNPHPTGHWAHFPDLEGTIRLRPGSGTQLLGEAGLGDGFEVVANVNSQDTPSMGLAQICNPTWPKLA